MDQDPRVVSEAIDITRSCAQILNDVGLGLGFLLECVYAASSSAYHSDLLKPGDDAVVPALTVTPEMPDLLAPREPKPYRWHNEPPPL